MRTFGLGLTAVLVFVALAAGATVWFAEGSDAVVRIVSDEGGVSVAVPRDWRVEQRHPLDEDHQEFLDGRERRALGLLERAGFWVARWPAAPDATSATVEDRLRKEQSKKQRDEWSLTEAVVAGHRAVVVRYAESPKSFERRFGDARVVVRELVANGFVYQVGTWALPLGGGVTRTLDEIAHSLKVFTPKPWTVDVADTRARFKVPGGWVERESDLKDAIFHALSPGDPNDAWAYVFRYPDSPSASLRAARAKIPANGGQLVEQRDETLGGRDAVRLEFFFGDGERGMAHGTEWFVSDGKGGSFVFAVGRRAGNERIADRLADTWRF